MQSPNDWKNVEISGYLKLNSQGGDVRGHSGALVGGHFTLWARGGKHTGFGASQGGCEATSYHADWAYNGTTRFAKEQWHVSYVFTPYEPSTDSIIGKWVGFNMCSPLTTCVNTSNKLRTCSSYCRKQHISVSSSFYHAFYNNILIYFKCS
jgi:hypothetical protein